ncbi:MAG: methyltransferase domain-containing protein [Woeseiaceae bacterium]|nr:methyltransferase domain-containing protein [Woeseiaceae bacterium]
MRRRFDRAAARFDDAAFVHAVTRDGLFARLEPMTREARLVVDLGAATGRALEPLAKRFPKAHVVAIDVSGQMARESARRRGWFKKIDVVQADARALPLADASVDVVFSNLLLPWIDDPAPLTAEVSRVLAKDGLFAFSTLGPDSLRELGGAWAGIDDAVHVNRFLDMHDVGDALVRAGLRDPVLDVDRLTVTYEKPDALFRDLTAAGARNSLSTRAKGLTGRQRFAGFRERLAPGGGRIALDLELVYGHCFGGGERVGDSAVRVDVNSIPIRRSRS